MRATLSSQGNLRGVRIWLHLFIAFSGWQLARKYLSVQATSTPAEHVMSSMGIVLEKRRQSMTGELFAEIMFLSDTV